MSSKRPLNTSSFESSSVAAGAEVPKRSRVVSKAPHTSDAEEPEKASGILQVVPAPISGMLASAPVGTSASPSPSSASVAAPTSAFGFTPNRIGSISVDFDDGTPCTFQKVLGEDAHCHILSYILCLPPAPQKPQKNKSAVQHYRDDRYGDGDVGGSSRRKKLPSELYEEFFNLSKEEGSRYISVAAHDKERYVRENAEYETHLSQMFAYPQRLANLCRELLTVSKHWRRVIGKLMNLKAPKDVLHPTELANIKARVGRLDLSKVGRHFLSLCHDMWASRRFLPSDLYHDHHHHHPDAAGAAGHEHKCPLEYIVRHYARGSYQNFAQLVSNEYCKFLVIKCVEMIAESCQKNEPYWAASSNPGQIVHLFRLAHMTNPRKYYQDCMFIIGDIIDCEHSSYQTVSTETVGQYLSKRRTLFSFEHQLSSEYFFTGPKPAFYYVENVVEVASMLRDEEAMREHRERDHDLDGDELFTDIDED